jgi:hypothetical protein
MGHAKMTKTVTLLETRNPAWGFYGTLAGIAEDRFGPAARIKTAEQAWVLAFDAIKDATLASDEGVRDFLDATHGRHFADDVGNFLHEGKPLNQAIKSAVDRWMVCRINRKTARETGIPMGLPYLTGWVTHYEIMADAA